RSHALAAGARGRGLLQALVLSQPVSSAVQAAALDAGLIVNAVAPDAIRLAPPLIIDEADLDEMADKLGRALAQAEKASNR
ncbi:MAG TPA: aminotransferase class III-fold pyridoxal phosphate-dependent enzyme, partial [Egibacteraceae bacterium]|nr:aminotransferase class III-fold pyridoxal phosphate-dependent enzyme [Egibacteraceae bacterium]